MKLIQPKAEYLPQATIPSGSPEDLLDGIYKQIELAGRTCYRSEDKITEGSAKPFVDRMIKSKHGAALEHGTVYLKAQSDVEDTNFWIVANSPYAKVVDDDISNITYITTNLRAVIELFPTTWHGFLNTYMCKPTEQHEKRYTMRFTCSRAIAQELTRHRVFSFLMESQRYINYSKERHGRDITFIKPYWLNCIYEDIPPQSELCYLAKQHPDEAAHRFIASLVESKYAYMTLLQKGCTPQQARDVLPNATKTELIMAGFASDWRHFFDLRLFEKTGKADPNMLQLAKLMQTEAEKQGIWNDIMKQPSKFD